MYALIDMVRREFSISELCDFLEASLRSFHSRKEPLANPRRRVRENALLKSKLKPIYAHRHTNAYGSRRMTPELKLKLRIMRGGNSPGASPRAPVWLEHK